MSEQLNFGDLLVWDREWKLCRSCKGDPKNQYCFRCLNRGGYWVARLRKVFS